jgi:hypothetical protein
MIVVIMISQIKSCIHRGFVVAKLLEIIILWRFLFGGTPKSPWVSIPSHSHP